MSENREKGKEAKTIHICMCLFVSLGFLCTCHRSQCAPYPADRDVSGHLSYFICGYGLDKPAYVVSVGYPLEILNSVFSRAEESGKIYHKYSMPYENNIPIYLFSQPKFLMSEVWEKFKHMN